MEKLVSFELARLAKIRGFVGNTEQYYVLNFSSFKATGIPKTFSSEPRSITDSQPHMASAMTLTDLQAWLRDEYDIHVEITSFKYSIPELNSIPRNFRYSVEKMHASGYTSYEQALEAGLLFVFENKHRVWKKKELAQKQPI